jgi:hypothetical protein
MRKPEYKNYTVSLIKEDAENLKTWLEPQGITFSSYLQMLISDTMVAVNKFLNEKKTPVVSASGLLEIARQMAKEEENAKKKKQKRIL